jgi:hypothetical protein
MIFWSLFGHSEALEQVGATKLADYTDQLVQHYKIDLVGNHAYQHALLYPHKSMNQAD